MSDIKLRIAALQKQMDAQKPNGGVLIKTGDDSWLAISATTLKNHQLFIEGKAAALAALSDCKKIYDHSGTEPQKGKTNEQIQRLRTET